MAEADRIASEELGIPLESLMENASHQIAVAARLFLGGVAGKRIVAFAGTGNNGGDALGALRHLSGWGANVAVVLSSPAERLRPLARRQHDILAVDLPSGLHPDTGDPLGVTIRAALTVTLALPKRGLIATRSHALVGDLLLADIGIPPQVFDRLALETRGLFESGDLVRIIR